MNGIETSRVKEKFYNKLQDEKAINIKAGIENKKGFSLKKLALIGAAASMLFATMVSLSIICRMTSSLINLLPSLISIPCTEVAGL